MSGASTWARQEQDYDTVFKQQKKAQQQQNLLTKENYKRAQAKG